MRFIDITSCTALGGLRRGNGKRARHCLCYRDSATRNAVFL